MKPLLLYVHIPFCPSKCHFCFWVKDIPVADLRRDEESPVRAAYTRALRRQIRELAPTLANQGYTPTVMYWGGGTPSVLTPDEVQAVMTTLRDEFDLGALREATIEATPDTLTPEKLRTYRDVGFTRVSIGAQSFDDERLARLARTHRAEQIRVACEMARQAGFEEVNVDLMCGLPDERLPEVERTMTAAAGLPVTHFSVYPYGAADGTVLHRQLGRGQVHVDRTEQVAAYELARDVLTASGFPEYSMCYFGRRPCQADMVYYRLEADWAGFGSGAMSVLGQEMRYARQGNLMGYIEDPTRSDVRQPARDPWFASARLLEGLGTHDGVNAVRWRERLGETLTASIRREPARRLVDQLRETAGLVEDADGVRLPREHIVRAIIDVRFSEVPRAAPRETPPRRRSTVRGESSAAAVAG